MKRKLADLQHEFQTKMNEMGFTKYEEFKNNRYRMFATCKNGHRCNIQPRVVLQGNIACESCPGFKKENESHKPKAAREQDFIEAVEKLGGKVLGKYVRSDKKVDCICKNGHKCSPRPYFYKVGLGMCNYCNPGRKPKEDGEQEFCLKIKEAGGNVIGQYKNKATRVECVCPNGHKCQTIPRGFLNGCNMCTYCSGHDGKWNKELFYAKIESLNATVVGDYKDYKTKIECRCAKNHKCFASPLSIVMTDQEFCRLCAPRFIGQTKVGLALSELKLNFKPEFQFLGSKKRFDYAIVDKKVVIEFDGAQHFLKTRTRLIESDFLTRQQNDKDKYQLAKEQGFKMIRMDDSWTYSTVHVFSMKLNALLQEIHDHPNNNLWLSSKTKYAWFVSPEDDDVRYFSKK